MAEEKKNQEPQKEEPLEEPKEEPLEKAEVTLSAEQYNALLDRLDELEELAKKPLTQEKVSTIDELAKEVEEEKEEGPKGEIDWEQVSPEQAVEYVLSRVREEMIAPLYKEIMVERITREIEKLESEVDDFDEYAEEVQKLMLENPRLSVKRAYLLAKAELGPTKGKGKGEGEEEEELPKPKDLLRTLPPRPAAKRSSGEKPGMVAPGKKAPQTLKEAVELAAEEVGLKD